MENLAACGAYVLFINRHTWFGGIEQWGTNVMGAYEILAKNPHIDRGRVYLFCISAEDPYMSAFVTNSPGLWKGIICLGPYVLPDFSGCPRGGRMPKILTSNGSEAGAADWLKRYQADALKQGVIVESIIHPGEQHYILSKTSVHERSRAMAHFIFEE